MEVDPPSLRATLEMVEVTLLTGFLLLLGLTFVASLQGRDPLDLLTLAMASPAHFALAGTGVVIFGHLVGEVTRAAAGWWLRDAQGQ